MFCKATSEKLGALSASHGERSNLLKKMHVVNTTNRVTVTPNIIPIIMNHKTKPSILCNQKAGMKTGNWANSGLHMWLTRVTCAIVNNKISFVLSYITPSDCPFQLAQSYSKKF